MIEGTRSAWRPIGALALAVALSFAPVRADEPPGNAPPYSVAALPPLRFVGGVIGDDLYNTLRQAPRFRQLGRDMVGSPIELRVYRLLRTTGGNRAKGEVTGVLAASTLGLIPMVISGEHEIIYEYRVNGRVVSRYSYKKAITRSINLWKSNDTTHGLGKDGLEWARSTADRFLQDSASDAALAAVVEEYNAYFTPTAVPTG